MTMLKKFYMSEYRLIIIAIIVLFLSACSHIGLNKKSIYDLGDKAESVEVDTDDNGAVDVAYGGTNGTSASAARTALGAAESGANTNITSLGGITTPLSIPQGGRGSTTSDGPRLRGVEGITVQTFGSSDATPDVTNGTTSVHRLWQVHASTSPTITDFDDTDDHSEFSDGDWFYLIVNYTAVIDFSDNSNIEGNANVDFTGSASQIVVLHFVFEGTQWKCTNLNSGMSTPTNLSVSSISADMIWGSEITGSGSISAANLSKLYLVSAVATVTLPKYSTSVGSDGDAPWVKLRIQDDSETLTIDVDNADKINRSGTAQAAGVTITTDGAGTTVLCEGSTNVDGAGTDGWFCSSNGTLAQGS